MSIVIDFKSAGFPDLQKSLERLEATMERVEALMQRMSRAAGQFGRSVSGVQVPGAPPRLTRQTRQVSGAPPTNYDMYRYWGAQATATGNRAARAQQAHYMRLAYQDAQRDFAAGKHGAAGRMNTLANQMAKQKTQIDPSAAYGLATGGGAAAARAAFTNPYTAAVAAAALSVGALAIAGNNAANGLNKMAKTAYSLGAPISQSGFASRLSGLGIDAGAAYQAAMSPGYGRAIAGQFGMDLTGGPFGNLNQLDATRAMMKAIFNSKSEGEAIRMAHAFGNPGAAKWWWLDKGRQQDMLSNRRSMSAAELQRSAQFDYDKEALVEKWDKLLMRAQMRFLPVAEKALSLGERMADNFMPLLNGLEAAGKWLSPWAAIAGRILGNGGTKAGGQEAALEANTRALGENTRAMKDMREVLGGGDRARSVLPQGVRSQLKEEQYRRAIESGVA